MDFRRLRAFVAVADELHFGRAAQRLELLPAALGRDIAQLEEDLRTQLFIRTTRHVALTETGHALLEDARDILRHTDQTALRIRSMARATDNTLHLGAIDSAAAGLVPRLLQDLQQAFPEIRVELIEEKTIRLLPMILSGRIDLALVRPPEAAFPAIAFAPLFHESAVVALADDHPLTAHPAVSIEDLRTEPLIVPARRSRPHSYDLTMKLFAEAGLRPLIAQQADEKRTIVGMVAARLGSAIVPRWTSRMAASGVVFRPLQVAPESNRKLPLAAAWMNGARDPTREKVVELLTRNLDAYRADA